MKRSDMVKFITQEYAASHRGGMSEMTDEERMSYILVKLEEAGMKPPAYWVQEGKDSFPPDGIPCMHIGWEKE